MIYKLRNFLTATQVYNTSITALPRKFYVYYVTASCAVKESDKD